MLRLYNKTGRLQLPMKNRDALAGVSVCLLIG